MNKFTVVASGDGPADCLLPRAALIARRAGRVYRIYIVDGIGQDRAFDDIDGETLVEYRSFDTLEAARTWAERDAALRLHRAETSLRGTVQ